MAPKIEVIHDETLTLGEGPHWDHEAQALYYVDILESTVFKYVPSTKIITRVVLDKQDKTSVSFIVPVAGAKDKFLIGYGASFALLTWDGVSTNPTNVETLVEVDQGLKTQFNDGKVDPQGRVWSGTMAIDINLDAGAQRLGSFYSLAADGKSVTKHFKDVGISNGLAWSSDHKTFYYVDSYNKAIHAFDYDIHKGELKNRRTVFDLVANDIKGLPDGMTIDTEDKLWLAVFEANAVIHVDPKTGSLLQTIKFPTSQITSATWGGPNLDELYVTSATLVKKAEDERYGGRTFKVTGLGASGLPGVPAKL